MTNLSTHLSAIGAPHTPEVCAHIRKLVEQEQQEDRIKRGVMFVQEVNKCGRCNMWDETHSICTELGEVTNYQDVPSRCPLREKE